MAQQTASSVPAASAEQAESKREALLASGLTDYLKRYTPSATTGNRDTLDGRYQVDLAAPLPEFNTRMAQAYAASDRMDPAKRLIAFICKPGSVQRHTAIQQLRNFRHPNLLPLVTAGAMELSQPAEERFVIIYDRPAGKKLSELMAEAKGPLDEQFLIRNIIAPVAGAINQLSELGIAHGAVNPDNIYFTNVPVLGECTSEPCGYSQPFYCEPVERMQALPAGKGEGSAAQDYYALAVVTLYLLHGASHFSDLTPQTLMLGILREGAYAALTRNKPQPEIFDDFLRGLLSQQIQERWNWQQIKPWLDGKRYNVLLSPPPAEAMRPFEFGGMQIGSKRELAHLFFQDWAHMAEPVANGQLLQWVSVSMRNKDMGEAIKRIGNSVKELGSRNEIQLDEQLMRILVLLDPSGPVRINQLAFHLDGIDALCAELTASKAQKELHLLMKIIEFDMLGFWLDQQKKGPEGQTMSSALSEVITRLDRLRLSVRNANLGFGPERALYDLNPEMSCQSPLLAGHHITTLPQLMTRLDRMAPQLANQDPVDRHIAAFIASKLMVQHDIRMPELAALPAMATHRAVISLKLLAMAQQRCSSTLFPGVTHWISLRLLPALDQLHSRTIRSRMKTALADLARSGDVRLIAELIINPGYSNADQKGYDQAWTLYHTNMTNIDRYRKGHMIDQHSTSMGYAIAKILSYAAFFLTLAALLQKS